MRGMKSNTSKAKAVPKTEMASETVKLSVPARIELAQLATIFKLPVKELASQALIEGANVLRQRGTIHFKAVNQQEYAA